MTSKPEPSAKPDMELYVFHGSGDWSAVTLDSTGGNLPKEHGDWKLARVTPITVDGIRDDRIDLSAMLNNLKGKGYHLCNFWINLEIK